MNEAKKPSVENVRREEARHVMNTFARNDVQFVEGSGMTLYDSEGRQYIDFLAGIAVCSLGHAHPALTATLRRQAGKLLHVSNYFYVEHRAETAAMIDALADGRIDKAAIIGESGCDYDSKCSDTAGWKTFFANSGAEANECAMKLARLHAKRNGRNANAIVCMRGGFHGRTLETVAATMQERLQRDFQPLPSGFIACSPNDETELERIFAEQGENICAVMLEPIQGESGVHPMTKSFMKTIRRLTSEHQALMICDEVQTGVFRCGSPFAFQIFDVVPDIFTMAKGIAGGVPMGACAAQADIADTFTPGDHGTTFGGSPLACAAARTVLSELSRGRFDKRVNETGAYLKKCLADLPNVVEVRGAGLMVGCDLADDMPDAHDVVADLLSKGFVVNATGPRTLRLLPPLICEKRHIDALVDALAKTLAGKEG
ncbi:MAG: acetylornithine/succinylornithine family transaminase [Slackia sp.]|nr:acetylornithine/succinylornithine family transaminase [Slackia sp.]